MSDKHITEHCRILSHLLPGDIVLAHRGFDISDLVGIMQAHLHVPSFTKGKNQLMAPEVHQTRNIAKICVFM